LLQEISDQKLENGKYLDMIIHLEGVVKLNQNFKNDQSVEIQQISAEKEAHFKECQQLKLQIHALEQKLQAF